MIRTLCKIEELLKKKWLILTILAAAGVIVYVNSFSAPFHLDDFGSISNNYSIREPFNIAEIWKFYSNRFIIYFTFAINYFIHQTGLEGYHITNVVIHIFNGFILYLIMYNILSLKYFNGKKIATFKRFVCILAAVMFIVHPMQVNAVTYIVQRTASLAATFYLLAIFFFIKFRVYDKVRYFVLVMLFTILAMFTKENTITIPFMLLFIEILFFLKDGKTSWKKRLLFLFVLFLTVPIIPGTNLFLHGYSQSDPGVSFKASTSMDRMWYFYTSLNVIILYIKLLFIPNYQNFDYSNDYPISHNIWEHGSYISLIILVLIFLVAVKNFKRNKLITLGIVWFFMGLAVESSFISIKDVYFEHRVYYPLAGFVIALMGIVFAEFKSKDRKMLVKKPLLYFTVLSAIVIIMNSALTLRRNYIYSDTVRLWSDVVKKAPMSDRGHSSLGASYLDYYDSDDESTKKYLKRAEEELKIAIQQYPYNDTAHCNLSKTYYLEGEYDLAIKEAEETNKISPSVYAFHNMGKAYEKKGNLKDALWAFTCGYNRDKKATFILDDLGSYYYDQKDYVNAKKYYEEYQKLAPTKSNIIAKRLNEIDQQLNK